MNRLKQKGRRAMNKGFLKYGLFVIVVILLQVLILNNIEFSGFINPYIYVMIIMLLPLDFPQWLVLITAFASGFVIDASSGTLGIHSAATVMTGFMRPYILLYMSPRDGYEQGVSPSMQVYGFRWFFIYAAWMLFIHHFAFFYLEVFRFTDFFRTLLRVILSTGFSLIFVILTEYYRKLR
ncbi:MAG: rod shape-determining protein MreD [Bacteroidales bacterium]|nr:rod shape-determining protein MreD [Bacteroidales bacterium]